MAIGTAYIKIMPEAKGISNSIGGLVDPAAETAGKTSGNKYIGALKKVIAGAAIGKWIGSSVLAGADLEQSIGGIETLYKSASGKMQQYASQAYKTAGVDANTYMQQVTSYSAGLIASMGGDVDAAADVANMAMIDMADNANKLGTPIENIQNAYQGFAKQNYTMLDNLKLGYGGTKTEMERLLKDAQKITGVKYDINNLDDVYNAIHVIQTEIGITGTTQEEASATIAGSIGMVKAAYKDLIANLALGKDVYPQIKNLISSIGVMLKNVLPAIGRVVIGIPKAILEHFPEIQNAIRVAMRNAVLFFMSNFPQWKTAVVNLISGAGSTIVENAPMIIGKITTVMQKALSLIGHYLPQIVAGVLTIVKNIGVSLLKSLPNILKSVFNLAGQLINSGLLVIDKLLKAAFSAIIKAVKNLFSNVINSVKTKFAEIKTNVSAKLGEIKTKITTGVATFATKLSKPFIDAKIKIASKFNEIRATVGEKISALKSKISAGVSTIADKLTHPFRTAKETIKGIVDKLKSIFPLKLGRIFDGIKLPHFKISGGKIPWGIGGAGEKPSVSVEWYKKAETDPYMFTKGTLFGAGEHNDEILYGRKRLLEDIASVSNGEITINVYGGNLNPKEIAEEVERRLIQSQKRRQLAWQ